MTVSIYSLTPAWVFIEKCQYIIGERGGTLTVRIRRDGYLWDDIDVSVDLVVTDGTATGGGVDFLSPVTGTAIFSAGDDSVDMVFTISEDTVIEDTESFTITLTNPSGAFLDEPSVSTVFIEDQTDISVVDITTTVTADYVEPVTTRATFGVDVEYFDMTFPINTDNIEEDIESFTVTLQNPLGGAIVQPQMTTVFIIDESDVNVQDVTATESTTVTSGVDYTSTGVTTVVFNEGVDYVDIIFDIVSPDDAVEDVERFTVTLQNPVGGFINTNEPVTTTVYILDETAWFYIEKDSYTVYEQTGTLTVRIRRRGYLWDSATVSVNFNIEDKTTTLANDYSSPVQTSVTFAPGVDYADVDFTILEDNFIEDKESFTISLTSPLGGVIGIPSFTTVYIEDKTALFWIEDKQCIVNEGQTIDVVFHRSGFLGQTDTLTLSAIDGTATLTDDYSLPNDVTITFAEGSTTSSKSLTIHQDNMLEHWEDFSLFVDIGTVSGQRGVLYSPIKCTVYIRDPTWYNFDSAEYITWEHESTVLIGVQREGDTSQNGRVEINIEDGSATLNNDYSTVETSATIEFASGVRLVRVPLTILDDATHERDEVLTISLQAPSSGEAIGNINKAVVKIVDDDAFFWIEDKYYIVNEGQPIDIVFHRSGFLGQTDTLTLSAIDGTATLTDDYSLPDDVTITFTEGSTISSKSLTIHRDNMLEHWEDFSLSADIGTISGQHGVIYSPMKCTVYIRDPTWYNFDSTEYITWEHESTVLIGVQRNGDISQSGRVGINIEDGSATVDNDYSTVETSATIEFASGVRLVRVPLTILDDASHERDEVLTISLQAPGSGEAIGNINRAVVKIVDDDEPIRPSINWILIAALGVILALLVTVFVTLCLCYLRLARRITRKSLAVETVPQLPPQMDMQLTSGPPALLPFEMPESFRYSYPALN
ncbi:FRAS1-related extracellular matrix protein 2-like [Amphiura filiformis]|uniref:FRAS1-related extracellular matrix protein 2-like n=1 Tax=Amphiura filiformis TaxID=82378 RepID=UPI003B21F484